METESYDSWLWKSWLGVRKFLKLGLRYKVGNGRAISIWTSPWVPEAVDFKPQCCFDSDKSNLVFVSDLMNAEWTQWDENRIYQIFTPSEACSIIQIPISREGHTDQLVWHQNPKGHFTVKDAYNTILLILFVASVSDDHKDIMLLYGLAWSCRETSRSNVSPFVFCT
ncbi:ribonuclease H-like superfamily protein [Striga asiatica]|uniref:Ribonuclease H-like superfamily protein n=1 Tax=Striga asiatica TaxID=4170 RepID=A0A5A7PYT6_STRAF|nr:ribonuclease H-like superfamily protein [Striga asiatica]